MTRDFGPWHPDQIGRLTLVQLTCFAEPDDDDEPSGAVVITSAEQLAALRAPRPPAADDPDW
jgi:hypothetical protein